MKGHKKSRLKGSKFFLHGKGLEPLRTIHSYGPEPYASTSSATRAFILVGIGFEPM